MSSLQDIPLEETTDNALPSTGLDTSTPKSNSLKRFFKVGNKKTPGAQESCEDVTESALPEANKDAATGGAGKTNTLSRFFTRMKGAQRTDGLDPAATISKTTANIDNEAEMVAEAPTQEDLAKESTGTAAGSEKPVPNAKPTLKASISTYWKLLFTRQKATAYQQSNKAKFKSSLAAQQSLRHVDEVQELEMVQQPLDQESTDEKNASLAGQSADLIKQQDVSDDSAPALTTVDNSVANSGN
ncbi:uncharacterized protein Dwil_GK13481 [Drosophila willistoni]|uniref:Uncharacterized protein n=1 Tax=Drosophila willistoni TaxID=7260 RepID=B4NIU1_DROWI|nr:uncharacterized protein LOC6650246 [Drosophila willistoni]EDW83805.2 uncharacterized protein Dwil_GK13481 [Drosophila willistoni]